MNECYIYTITIAAFCTTPIDVAKTRLMTQKDNHYTGIWDTLHKIIKEGGISRLFSAVHIRTLNIAISGIIFFGTYEKIRYLIENQLNFKE